MTMLDDIKKLTTNDAAIGISVFVSIVAPGFLILHLFKPNLVLVLDTFKLLLFSLALTLPVVVVNFLTMAALHFFRTKDEPYSVPTDQDRIQAFVDSMAAAFVILYSSILFAFVVGLSFRQFLLSAALFQSAVFIIQYLWFRHARASNP